MQIRINTDHNIEGSEAVLEYVTHIVQRGMNRLSGHIIRVEVQLHDEKNSNCEFHDKRCMMEARLKGRQLVSVTHHARTLRQAIDGAVEKLERMIDSTLGRLYEQKSRSEELNVPEQPATEI